MVLLLPMLVVLLLMVLPLLVVLVVLVVLTLTFELAYTSDCRFKFLPAEHKAKPYQPFHAVLHDCIV